jgi:WS/DGAT/MGAT family acyltransferase
VIDVQRMSGFDAQFIYDERPDEPQHTLKISFLGQRASQAWSFASAKTDLARRLAQIEPLQWRALRVPFDLHHPVWVADPEIDLDWHLRRAAVPAPGGRDELCEAISQILSVPLDPSRPLWELWWLEGYEGGVVAVLKISHALADGSASRRLLELLHTPETAESPAATADRALPTRWTLIVDALRDLWRALVHHVPSLVRASVRSRARVAAARESDSIAAERSPDALGGPYHPLGGPLSRRRAFHFFSVPLDAARDVRRELGGTINDVAVAAVAGGLRRWLCERGALPGLPTRAFMPASIRTADEALVWGNRVTTRALDLPTQIADPIARLRAIQHETARAKEEVKLREGAHLEDWIRWLPPFAGKAISAFMRTYARVIPNFPGSVAISNVHGPSQALVGPWGEVENFVSVGHMKYSAGLNTTVWSYAGRLNFGFYACPRALPDLPRLSGHVADAFEELVKIASRPSSGLRSPSARCAQLASRAA